MDDPFDISSLVQQPAPAPMDPQEVQRQLLAKRMAQGGPNMQQIADPTNQGFRGLAQGVSDAVNTAVGPESWVGQQTKDLVGGTARDVAAFLPGTSMGTAQRVYNAAGSAAAGLPKMGADLGVGALTGTGPLPLIANSMMDKYAETGSVPQTVATGALSALPIVGSSVGGKLGGSMVEQWAMKKGAGTMVDGLMDYTAPKALGYAAGAITGGGLGMEAQRQGELTAQGVKWNDPARNPLSMENMAGQLFGGALYGAHEMFARGVGTGDWYKSPHYDSPAEDTVKQIGADPKWRKTFAKEGMDDIAQESDPQTRADKLMRITEVVHSSSGLEELGDDAEKTAKMTYLAPPTTPEGLAQLAQKVNTLKASALRLMDQQNEAGVPGSTSSAAYNQLVEQGHLKDEITYDWLKQRFGENVQRTLNGDNATAYQLLTQQLANHMFMAADAAKLARGAQLADTPESPRNVLDKRITQGFFDAVTKIPDKTVRDGLLDRFMYHEDQDNKADYGTARTFMKDVTHIVNYISAGKDPDSVGWKYDTAPFMKRTVQSDDAGQEVRPAVSTQKSLSQYLEKKANGDYAMPVYGRSGRNQREILESQLMRPDATGSGLIDSAEDTGQAHAESELAGMKGGIEQDESGEAVHPTESPLEGEAKQPDAPAKDWSAQSLAIKRAVNTADPEAVWNIIHPALNTGPRNLDSRTVARYKPMAKDLVTALLELGPSQAGTATNPVPISDAGRRVLTAMGGPVPGMSPSGSLSKRLMDTLGKGRNFDTIKNQIVGAAAKLAAGAGEGTAQISQTPDNKGREQYPRAIEGDDPVAGALVSVSPNRARALWEEGRAVYHDVNDGEALQRIDTLDHLEGVLGSHELYVMPENLHESLEQKVPGNNPSNLKPMVAVTPNGGLTMGASGTGNAYGDQLAILRPFYARLGYSPEEADHFIKLNLQVLANYNPNDLSINTLGPKAYSGPAQVAMQHGGTPTLDQAEIAGQYHNPMLTPTKDPLIALALRHTASRATGKEITAFQQVATMVHELTHDVQYRGYLADGQEGSPMAAYSSERVKAWTQLYRTSLTLSPEERYGYLFNIAHAVIPPQFLYSGPNNTMHPVIERTLNYGAGTPGYSSEKKPYEFVNVMTQLMGAGMVSGGNNLHLDPQDVFMHMPEEAALFAKGVYRDMHDSIGAMQAALRELGYPLNYTDQLGRMVDQVHKLVVSMEPAKSIHLANNMMAALSPGMQGWTGPTVHLPYSADAELSALVPAAKRTLELTQGLLFGPDPQAQGTAPATQDGKVPPKGPTEKDQLNLPFEENGRTVNKPVDIGWLWRNQTLAMQTLQHLTTRGIPLANDVMVALKDLEPAQTRLAYGALSPFMTVQGKFDPTNPTLQMEPGSRVRNTFNQVMNWQQRNKAEAFEQDPQTKQWKLTAKAQTDLGNATQLLGKDLPTLVGAVQNVQQAHGILGEQLLQSRVDSAASRIARMVMALQPGMPYDQASQAGTNIVRGLMLGTQPGGQPQLAKGLTPLNAPMRDAVLGLANSGIVDSLTSLQKQLASNTWFATEQRPGKYLVESYQNGVRHVDGAADFAAAQLKRQEISKLGYTDIKVISKDDKYAKDFSAPESILQHYIDVEREATERYLTTNPNQLSPDVIAQIRAYAPTPGAGVEAMLERRGTNKYTIRRQDVPSALGLDYLDNMREYISRLSATIARTGIQRKVDLIHADARLDGQDEFKAYTKQIMQAGMTPTGDLERSIRAGSSAYFLAANLSSTLVIGSHGLQTLPETLIRFDTKGGWIGNAMKHLWTGISDLNYLTSKDTANERDQLLRSGQAKLNSRAPLTKQETKVLAFKKAVDEKVLDAGIFQDLTHDEDVRSLMARNFAVGDQTPVSARSLLQDGLYRASKFTMALHGFASGYNNKVGFLAGLNQAIEQGKTFDQAYQHADNVRVQALFAGGKTNAPGYQRTSSQDAPNGGLGGPVTTPIMRTMYTLQRYGTGFMGRYLSHASDVITNDPNLTSGERAQAVKSFMTLTATQLALGGLLGLPGVAAMLALLEKSGVNTEAAIRKGLTHLCGADKDNSGFRGQLTETAMNGWPNQMLGVNIGPRLGVSDYMGTSAYDGFNLADLAGPTGSIVTNLFNGTANILKGNVQKGITTMVPNAIKRPVDMAMSKLKYGDMAFRDPATGQKMYDPSTADLLKYAAGLNPSQLSERQTMNRLMRQSNDSYERNQKQDLDQRAGQLAQGNPQPAYDWARNQVGLGATTNPVGAVRHVADRAAQMGQQQDPLSNVPLGNSDPQAIAKTFPSADLTRRSELSQAGQRIQMEASAGVPKADYSKDISKAAVMDSLIKQRGMTREQAERVALMLGLH